MDVKLKTPTNLDPFARSRRVHCEEKARRGKNVKKREKTARATRSVRAEFTKRSFKQSSLPQDRRSHKAGG